MPKAKRAPAASMPGQTDRVFLASLAVLLALATGWLIYARIVPRVRGLPALVPRGRSPAARARRRPRRLRPASSRSGFRRPATPTGASPATWPRRGAGSRPRPSRFARIPPRSCARTPSTGSGARRAMAARDGRWTRRGRTGRCRTGSEPLLDTPLADALMPGAGRRTLMELRCNVCHRYERETAGAPAINRAKRVVDQKGCRACHRVNGRGGLIGPDLDSDRRQEPRAIRLHAPGRAPERVPLARRALPGPSRARRRHGDAELPLLARRDPGAHAARDVVEAAGVRRGALGEPAEERPAARGGTPAGRGDGQRPRRLVRPDRLLHLSPGGGVRREEPDADRPRPVHGSRRHRAAVQPPHRRVRAESRRARCARSSRGSSCCRRRRRTRRCASCARPSRSTKRCAPPAATRSSRASRSWQLAANSGSGLTRCRRCCAHASSPTPSK